MAKQRKAAVAPVAPKSLGDEIMAGHSVVAIKDDEPVGKQVVVYVVGKGFKPRTNNGYGGKGRNPQESAWAAVVAALPADQSTLVGIVRQVATHNGALVANGPGYPASFVARRIRNGALVPQA